MLLKMKKQTRM